MSRQSKLEAVVFLLDVGQNANQDIDGQTFLNKSKQCASRIIQRKIFSGAKDQLSLVLIGSEKTDNELNYPNINVVYSWLSAANFSLLKEVENLSTTSVDSADWLDGLVVAVNLLKNESECKKFEILKIVMLSNFGTQIRTKDQVEDVIEALRELKINLVVIGLNDEEEVNSGSEDSVLKSKIQRKGEIIISRIVDEADGITCSFDEAMSQLDHFQKVIGRAQPWQCDLDIGGEDVLLIPITGFKKVVPKTLLKWIKRTQAKKASVAQETVYFRRDDEVDKSDIVKCYKFGQSIVPVSDDDKNAMKLTTLKSLKVIGFTKKKNVPQYRAVGDSVHYIAPRSDVESAEVALTAFVKALLELEMVAIVRKVYCKNAPPRIGALVPVCEDESYFFYFIQLPFSEDEQYLKLPSLKKLQPTQSQVDIVDQLIDDMDLSQFEEDEDPYSRLVDPSVEHGNSIIVFKALHPSKTKVPLEPSEAVLNLIQPKREILENASNTLENIKKLFQLEELEQKKCRRRAADVFERNRTEDMEVVDVKPQIIGDSMVSFVQSTVTEIGTIDPESNFLKLLELGEPSNKLCEQMQRAIQKLILTSSNTMGIQKSFSALVLLRKHCVEQNPYSYNQFIACLKDELLEREHNEFWNKIVQDKLGLITLAENGESGVNAEEAEIFYQIKKCESQVVNYEMEAEDMLDMI